MKLDPGKPAMRTPSSRTPPTTCPTTCHNRTTGVHKSFTGIGRGRRNSPARRSSLDPCLQVSFHRRSQLELVAHMARVATALALTFGSHVARLTPPGSRRRFDPRLHGSAQSSQGEACETAPLWGRSINTSNSEAQSRAHATNDALKYWRARRALASC
jgi:hypothetical protein